MKLKHRMEELVARVEQHPLLAVSEWSCNPPLDPALFDLFEETYGVACPETVKECYGEMNGFCFRYQLADESDKGVAAFNALSPDYTIEKGPPYTPGSIVFLAFEKIFLQPTWERMLYNTGSMSDEDAFRFAGKQYTYNSFGKLLKPFDLFSAETAAAFLLVPGFEFRVLLLLDHYADWKNSLLTGFDEYCRLILDTGGLVEGRERFLSETDGDEKPAFSYKRTKVTLPSLWKKNNLFT